MTKFIHSTFFWDQTIFYDFFLLLWIEHSPEDKVSFLKLEREFFYKMNMSGKIISTVKDYLNVINIAVREFFW